MRSLTISALTLLALSLAGGSALAFHDGGVAYCQGCHTMHNSQGGAPVDAAHPAGNAYLLNNGSPSDTCLKCHAGYGQFASGLGFGPGGDFYWLTKTFSYSAHGRTTTLAGSTHGHNIIAPAYGLTSADPTLSHAPGGTFLSQYMSCTSCHDPHGNENFRLLYGGAGNDPKYDGTRYSFANPAPLALGNARTTNAASGLENNVQHTVYKSGMSEWCANCHSAFHSPNTTNFVHPTGVAMGSTTAAAYNAYVSTDNLLGGTQATSYWGLVPFEAVNVDLATANSTNYTTGPDAQDRVMCLTCHRAHASPFSDNGRWDFSATYIADSHPLATDTGASADDVARKYYNYTFATLNQRSLCNKCHAKDALDEPVAPPPPIVSGVPD